VERAAANDPLAQGILQNLAEASAALEEGAGAIRKRLGVVSADPGRLEEVEDRLEAIRRLERKHGSGVEAILEKLARMERELWELDNRQSALEDARGAMDRARAELDRIAGRLGKARRSAAKRLETEVGGELEGLGLAKASFLVDFSPSEPGPKGADTVHFSFAPNVGETPKPLARIASGGELSRVLLAVKNALRDGSVGTLVFDEVDAGIGGQVADRVGERLQRLGGSCQVVCVTHLPQIASRTGSHLRVEKVIEGGRTVTRVRRLDAEERVEELARMLGGKDREGAAYAHARELAERSGT
jgi:DNA repair protein RecN (Recombination protein N)